MSDWKEVVGRRKVTRERLEETSRRCSLQGGSSQLNPVEINRNTDKRGLSLQVSSGSCKAFRFHLFVSLGKGTEW